MMACSGSLVVSTAVEQPASPAYFSVPSITLMQNHKRTPLSLYHHLRLFAVLDHQPQTGHSETSRLISDHSRRLCKGITRTNLSIWRLRIRLLHRLCLLFTRLRTTISVIRDCKASGYIVQWALDQVYKEFRLLIREHLSFISSQDTCIECISFVMHATSHDCETVYIFHILNESGSRGTASLCLRRLRCLGSSQLKLWTQTA